MLDPLTSSVTFTVTGNGEFPYTAMVDGTQWVVRVNDFPEDPHVYSLLVNDEEAVHFDEWPASWTAPRPARPVEPLVLRGPRSRLRAADVSALLTRCREQRILALTLDDIAFEPGALAAFFAGLAQTPLDALVLRGHANRPLELPADAIVSWLRSAAQLRDLALEHTTLGDDIGLHFQTASSFSSLVRLSLGHSRIGPASVRALASHSALSTLQDLDLRGNPVGPRVHELLEPPSALHSLERIGLTGVGYVKETDVEWNDGASASSGWGTEWTPLTAAEITHVTGLTLEIY